MLDDIISKFANDENIADFDFSLRSERNIGKPLTGCDFNCKLEAAVAKSDKSILAKVLLEEARNNINFAYRALSQITDVSAEEEGQLFKTRLIEILTELNNKYSIENEVYASLLNFADTLLNMINNHINDGKLKNAFIISMLLFEVCEDMKVKNIYAHYINEYEEIILVRNITFLHIITVKMRADNDKEQSYFFIGGILKYINEYSYFQNIDVCFDMLYFASLIADEKSAETVSLASDELKAVYKSAAINNYVASGIEYSNGGCDKLVEYVCKHANLYHFAGNIARTCLFADDKNAAETILTFFVKDAKTPKNYKLSFYEQLQAIYYEQDDMKKIADIAKERFILGDKKAYFEAIAAYTSLGIYEEEKYGLHQMACKQVPIYGYCCLLANNKEYDLLLDRINIVTSAKDISESIKFIGDKWASLYEDGVNKKILNILAEKTKKYKKLAERVKNLLKVVEAQQKG